MSEPLSSDKRGELIQRLENALSFGTTGRDALPKLLKDCKDFLEAQRPTIAPQIPRDDEIRLAMGELTADQMRTAKAAIRWVLSRQRTERGENMDELTHLRMQIGYLAGELQIAGDKRTTPEIVENAAKATAPRAEGGTK